MNIRPLPKESLIGEPASLSLDNGLRTYVLPRHAAPVVSVQAWVKTGSIHEAEWLGCGLSHFLEHMLFQGSLRYPKQSASELVHKLGGDINAYTSHGVTVYYIELPAEHVGTALDILCDMIQTPVFPKAKFKLEKDVILRERDMGRDNPGRVINERLWLECFDSHPVRHPIIGYRPLIESVDQNMMKAYYERRYTPGRSFFVVTGAVSPELVFERISELAGAWAPRQLAEIPIPLETPRSCAKNLKLCFKDPLARIALAYQSPPACHEDVPALDVLASILGQNKGSRLVQKLKHERQLAINISSFNYTPLFCGIMGVSALCSPENADGLKRGIFDEIEKIRSKPAAKSEVESVVAQQVAEYLRTLRSNSGLARMLGNSILSYGVADYADKYIAQLTKITAADIKRVAANYLNPEKATLLTMLPDDPQKTKSKPSLAKQACPSPELEKLPGGPRLVSLFEGSLPLFDLCAVLPGGTIFENEKNAGISQLIAKLLPAGTGKYTEQKLAELIDQNGLDLNISSGNNSCVLRIDGPRDRFDTALKLFGSILSEPLFREEEFEREKRNTLDSLKSRKLNPQNAAEDAMLLRLYGKHPYANPSCGREKSVASLSTSQVHDFYARVCLQPRKTVFGLAGDFDSKMLSSLRKMIASLNWSSSPAPALPKRPVFPDSAISEQILLPREQSVILIGVPACDNLSPARHALEILQEAMNGQASPLFRSIREDSGLAYYTGLYSSRGFHEGFLALYAGTHPEASQKVCSLIEKERRRLGREGLSTEEFDAGRACVLYTISDQAQNPGAQVFNSALSEFYGEGFRAPWQRADEIRGLSHRETNRIIAKYLSSATPVTVITGPGQK